MNGFTNYVGSTRGVLSDQGTEKDVSDICLDMLPRYRHTIDPQLKTSYVFPNLLGLPGLLHILYDALELCCKRNPLYKVWIDQLKTLTSFVTDASLVRKFKATCFEGAKDEANRFQRQATTHIDWKWEFMSKAMGRHLPQYPVIKRRFDADKLRSSDSGQHLENATTKLTGDVLKADNFLPIAEAYRIKGKNIEKCAGELAACDCHIDMWAKGRSRKRRLKRMQDSVGFESCCWEGRRLP